MKIIPPIADRTLNLKKVLLTFLVFPCIRVSFAPIVFVVFVFAVIVVILIIIIGQLLCSSRPKSGASILYESPSYGRRLNPLKCADDNTKNKNGLTIFVFVAVSSATTKNYKMVAILGIQSSTRTLYSTPLRSCGSERGK